MDKQPQSFEAFNLYVLKELAAPFLARCVSNMPDHQPYAYNQPYVYAYVIYLKDTVCGKYRTKYIFPSDYLTIHHNAYIKRMNSPSNQPLAIRAMISYKGEIETSEIWRTPDNVAYNLYLAINQL